MLEQFSQFHFLGKMDDDRDEHWEEGCRRQGEWNDHECHGKEEFHGEWKKQLDVWRGWIGGRVTQSMSQWHE
jgi:hypothetical protein